MIRRTKLPSEGMFSLYSIMIFHLANPIEKRLPIYCFETFRTHYVQIASVCRSRTRLISSEKDMCGESGIHCLHCKPWQINLHFARQHDKAGLWENMSCAPVFTFFWLCRKLMFRYPLVLVSYKTACMWTSSARPATGRTDTTLKLQNKLLRLWKTQKNNATSTTKIPISSFTLKLITYASWVTVYRHVRIWKLVVYSFITV